MVQLLKDRLAVATAAVILLFVTDNFLHATRVLKRDDGIDQAVQVLVLIFCS